MRTFLFVLFLLFLGAFGLHFALSKRSDCFSPTFVSPGMTELPKLERGPLAKVTPQEVEKLLSSPFTFLGSGNQSFAFVSTDGTVVLKLIKFHCLTGIDPYSFLPPFAFFKTIQKKHDKERQEKLHRVIRGFYTAGTKDPEGQGLLYLYFPGQKALLDHPLSAVVKDKAGRVHTLRLDGLVFALQKRAVPTGEVLKDLLDQGAVDLAILKMSALFEMIDSGLKKGVFDEDHNIMHNTGFDGDTPLRIDFGKVTYRAKITEAERKNEVKKLYLERLIPWLEKYYPSYTEQFKTSFSYISPATI